MAHLLGSGAVPRRLLALAAVPLVLLLAAGCADDVAPAAQIGDLALSADTVLAEVDEWAGSPTLLEQLQVGSVEGEGIGTYATGFVDFVLSNRIAFELHNAQFRSLGLSLTSEDLDAVRQGLFADPAVTEQVLGELSAGYREQLLSDVARQFAVTQAMADGYDQWLGEAYASGVEIDPRFGSWNPTTGAVSPPSGPLPAPGDDFPGL